jgi:chromate transport protein ChrA
MFTAMRGKLIGSRFGKIALLVAGLLVVRWLVQHPWVVITAGVLVVTCAVTVGGLLWTRRDRI